SYNPELPVSTRYFTSSGLERVRISPTCPPIELPTTIAGSPTSSEMNLATNFARLDKLVFRIGKSYTGRVGKYTLYPLVEKNSINLVKLLSPPISPCKSTIGVPSPSSMKENFFCFL